MSDPLWDDLSLASIEEALVTRYVGQSFIYLDSTTSTQDRAREEARQGAPEGTMVITDEQTAGRGRFGRSWVSPRANSLYLSLVMRPSQQQLMALNMVAGLAIVRAVREATGLEARIKWPNDVQLSGKKFAGILIDTELSQKGVEYAIIGVGLNVTLDPAQHPEIADIATSLSFDKKEPVRRMPVLQALLTSIEELYEATKRGESLLPEWKRSLATLGRKVRVTWPGNTDKKSLVEEGVAEDVDEEGALLLRKDDGTLIKVVAGEVSLRG